MIYLDDKLKQLCKSNNYLYEHSSYKIGGPTDYFFEPENLNDLIYIINYANQHNIKNFIFGMGTNILFPDNPDDNVYFISLKKYFDFKINENSIFLSSGIPISFLSIIGLINDLEELLFTFLLPGCIGGGIYMNAKYFDYQMSDIIENVLYYDLIDKKINEINVKSCAFGYKQSIFQNNKWIILGSEFKIKNLKYFPEKELYKIKLNKEISNLNNFYNIFVDISKEYKNCKFYSKIESIINDRNSKKHFDYPSCGSVFKNNYKIGIPIGKLVDDLGLKGLSHGGAMISPYHGNIIINTGNAKESDVIYLIKKIQEKIEEKYNFTPEKELIVVSEFLSENYV